MFKDILKKWENSSAIKSMGGNNDTNSGTSDSVNDERVDILTHKLTEFEMTAKKVFKRLEKKIEVLEAVEASVDEKLASFERLLQTADTVKPSAAAGFNRQKEVLALVRKGMRIDDIAGIMSMPKGEIELILNLGNR